MAFTKETVLDKIEIIMRNRCLQLRYATVISEDGIEISRTYERRVIMSNSDVTAECKEVQGIVAVLNG